jgi:hypothetical protein
VPLVTTTPDNFDALLTTTTQARQRILVDNIHDSTPTLMFYNMRGRKRMQDGGESILTPLLYAKSDSFQDFTGYQTIDVDPQEGITGAQWTWKESAVTVTISRRERRQNSGEHAVVSLLDSKMQQAELAAADGLNTRMLGTNAANTLRIFGFQNFFSAAAVGSQTGTVGGINKATYTWWNNQYGNVASAFSTNGLNIMRTTYNSASQGADHPDLIVTTQSGFENYERVVQPFERLQSSTQTEAGAKIGELGFQHLMFKGAFMFFDDACLANQMYMINTRYTDLVVDTQSDWSIQPFVTPNNQAATSALILWMGALTFSNLSRQGLVANVDTF